ncbi:MAG TPA: efflux RND transporter periplasmic adaptor subunit, partial [Nitrobacter sp.]|nr:efflux RND transporter periplasmic adaptor subunit [Nitrobacter sp.]
MLAATIGVVSPSRAADDSEPPGGALVSVARATNACFSDMVRVTGFVVPRREAVVSPDQEGSRVTDVLVREGDTVKLNQDLAKLTPPPGSKSGPVVLRAPAAGLVTEVRTAVGAPASPQAGPMFRIAINNEVELDAEVPSIHVLKLNPGASARISREDGPDLVGSVRLVSPEIDRKTQMGHVRLSLSADPTLRIGMFARAS